MSRLLLVRHGQTKTDGNRFWGKTDIPLSETGLEQAERLRSRLAGEKIKAVYSSHLDRARQTTAIIVSGRKIDVIVRRELAECNFGLAEGLTFEEITYQYPQLASELCGNDTLATFPGGESFADLKARVENFAAGLKKYQPGDTVLIVAHGSPLRVLICHLLGMDIRHWRQLRIDPGSLSIIETYPEGAILCRLNDICHLEERGKQK